MRKIKPRVKHQGVSLPVPFIKEIKEHIKHRPAYRSIADYTREAIREKMYRDNHTVFKAGPPPSWSKPVTVVKPSQSEIDKKFQDYIDKKFKLLKKEKLEKTKK